MPTASIASTPRSESFISYIDALINQLSTATIAYRFARYLRSPLPRERLAIELQYGRIQTACKHSARTAIEVLNTIYHTAHGLPNLLHTLAHHSTLIGSDVAAYAATELDGIDRRIGRLRTVTNYITSVGAAFDTDGLLYSAEFDAIHTLLEQALQVINRVCQLLHASDARTKAIRVIVEQLHSPVVR